MPKKIRAKMERAFGQEFSKVRIHEGPQAESIGALAYTQGNDIHFKPGSYKPQSQEGQRILGHELTHVVQQRTGRVAVPAGKGPPINADATLEAEAHSAGTRAARGESVAVSKPNSSAAPASGAAPIQAWGLPSFEQAMRAYRAIRGTGAVGQTAMAGRPSERVEHAGNAAFQALDLADRVTSSAKSAGSGLTALGKTAATAGSLSAAATAFRTGREAHRHYSAGKSGRALEAGVESVGNAATMVAPLVVGSFPAAWPLGFGFAGGMAARQAIRAYNRPNEVKADIASGGRSLASGGRYLASGLASGGQYVASGLASGLNTAGGYLASGARYLFGRTPTRVPVGEELV